MREGGEKPVEVFLVYALQEESDSSEGVAGVGTKFPECWGIK